MICGENTNAFLVLDLAA